MTEILEKGGVILWIIRAFSSVAAPIVIERLIHIRKLRGDAERMINRVIGRLGAAGDSGLSPRAAASQMRSSTQWG